MKQFNVLSILIAVILLCSCNNQEQTPHSKHVILLGFDAMGSYGFQRANTPNMNKMVEEGAIALNTRCVRETSSSQNWMSMISGTCIEHHGVFGNAWERDNAPIEPTVKNEIGLFPTVFDYLYQQRPDAKVYAYYQWTEQDRMYDLSHVTKRVTGYDDDTTLDMALEAYLKDQPEFLFVSLNLPDEMGHTYGHESEEYLNSITHLDAKVGAFVEKLKEKNMLDDVTIIITGDHGGIRYGHGGDSPQELLTAILMYGGNVTKGRIMEHGYMIYDVGATIAGLLNIELPRECVGKFIYEAYEPATEKKYVPVPFIRVNYDSNTGGAAISISADAPGCSIYYTTDGTTPTTDSRKYESPFIIDNSCIIKAIASKENQSSIIGDRTAYLPSGTGNPKVAYKYFENWKGLTLPNFDKIGKATKEGFIYDITLNALDVENKDDFAIQFSTKLNIPESGEYLFEIISDDGSALYIDGVKIIDNDGSHSASAAKTTVELEKGIHSIRVDYFDDHGGQIIELYWGSVKIGNYRPILSTDFVR